MVMVFSALLAELLLITSVATTLRMCMPSASLTEAFHLPYLFNSMGLPKAVAPSEPPYAAPWHPPQRC